MKKEKLQRIILDENFNLGEVLDILFESRGVIDGVDGMALAITNYINYVLSDDNLKNLYFDGYNKVEDVDTYTFTIPEEVFKNVDTLFMKNPIFTIYLYVMRNKYGDMDREIGNTNYSTKYRPNIINVDGQYYLLNPEFEISFIINPEVLKTTIELVADKISHEICHAKKNFYEFIRDSKYRMQSIKRGIKISELLDSEEKTGIDRLVGRILYLCSDDEINARANQLYYQLKQFRRIELDRDNINALVKRAKVYEFVDEFDDKIKEISNREEKLNSAESDYITKLLTRNYGIKNVGNNPYEYLISIMIIKKNKFIRQLDKVKERVVFETLRMPIIMGHPPKN